MVVFSEQYYRRVIAENGYNLIDFQPIDFGLLQLSAPVLQKKWLCHHDGKTFANGVNSGRPAIVTTGFGLSGTPHVGTISQMLSAIFLQRAGLAVQIVLGDLDAYNARKQSLTAVAERAAQYREFLLKLGFDESRGVLRTQIGHPEILLTAFLTANCLEDIDFLRSEEELSAFYQSRGVYPGITFPVKQAILLMAADFIHLEHDYEFVFVMLGLDEHSYVRLARTITQKMKRKVNISGLYSRMNRGLSGYPKMSKSLPGSGITADLSADVIRDLLLTQEGAYAEPMESPVYQMMCAASSYSPEDLDALYATCQLGGGAWHLAKRTYADVLISICEKWPRP